jgi:hypothetical protein
VRVTKEGQPWTVGLPCRADSEQGVLSQGSQRDGRLGKRRVEQAKKLKDLQKENAQLRRAVADLTVEKQVLKDIAQGNF